MIDAVELSIVIPTHNRSRYALACIQSILDIPRSNIEVVVHDTSDDQCELRRWAATADDNRLVYHHHAGRLSMTDNHEYALRLARGRFVCLIGDDDSVTASIVDLPSIADSLSTDVIVPSGTATYSWPDFETRLFGKAHAGKLYVRRFSNTIAEHSSEAALAAGLRRAFQGTVGMPKLYHGVVRRSLIDRIRGRTGRFFFGTSPDMSAALQLCLNTQRFHTIDQPTTLPGASGGSNSGRSALGRHKGDFRSDPHMAAFENLVWDDIVPKFFSVQTVWANAGWETLRQYNNPNYEKAFNIERLYAECLLKHAEFKNETWSAFQAAQTNLESKPRRRGVYKHMLALVKDEAIRKGRRALNPTPSYGQIVLGTFENVFDAQKALGKFIANG